MHNRRGFRRTRRSMPEAEGPVVVPPSRSDSTLDDVRERFARTSDFVCQAVSVMGHRGHLLYLNEQVELSSMLDLQRGLYTQTTQHEHESTSRDVLLEFMQNRFPFAFAVGKDEVQEITDHLLAGNTILLFPDLSRTFLFNTVNGKGRSITEPETELAVRGPREGFVESISTNIMLIRRRLRLSELKVEYHNIGRRTQTQIGIIYIEDIADPGIVKEVRRRLDKIDIDGILESSFVESFIQDAPYSPFPTVFSTERPDRVSAALLEGKVAIVTDGTPFVLTVPAMLVEFLHSNEDYYDTAFVATLVRWIRAVALFFALVLPSAYVSITTIHQDLLQTSLLLRVAGFREDLPYPVLFEAFFMQFVFEIVREAGLRMPKAIGSAVTIVGTLVIGQAAVQAGLVGSLMVIVTAVTALTTFIMPNYTFMQVIRYLSFPMLFLAGMFGFMGIHVGLIAILAHLASLRSFGVPFLSPLAPADKKGWKDVFLRAPLWSLKHRIPGVGAIDMTRAEDTHPPQPPQRGEDGDEQ